MSRNVLIIGATNNQGQSAVAALLSRAPSEFTLLAATRDPSSPSAQRLQTQHPTLKLIRGDLTDSSALLTSAKVAVPNQPIWAVLMLAGNVEDSLGKALVTASIDAGVSHFVYSSIDRGGIEHSWQTPTNVPHFRAKYTIENHLRFSTTDGKSSMKWTILRSVAFFENLSPGFANKIFMTAFRDTVPATKSVQWVSAVDVGHFAAEVAINASEYQNRVVGVAGDELTFQEMSDVLKKVTGEPAGTTFGFLGSLLKNGVKDVGTLLDFMGQEGFKVDLVECRKVRPGVMDFEAWLKNESTFPKI
ncbi:hypothetical protein HK097_006622 [Rhizophlyctis rosea]|uniref:NmrA-like domain-containing protein n=1 Tax=Rhizophlyctis rosea TaxID=64517 RepID=A0AAD5SE11_9FUNG|nr:hypothetical protein HK097_006622 [Rhizophlyctis rosea]